MDMQTEIRRRAKPWTIKGIPLEDRNAAIAAAEREGITLGEWFSRAIPTIIAQGRALGSSEQDPLIIAATRRGFRSGMEAGLEAGRKESLSETARLRESLHRIGVLVAESE